MTTPTQPLFTRRALWLIFGGGIFSLIFSFGLMWLTDPRDEVESIDTDTFSISALGHMAFLEMLEAHEVSTSRGRYKSHERMSRGDLLIVAEPHLMLGDRNDRLLKKYRTMLSKSSNTLLVLPKRDGLRDSTFDDWVGASFMVPEGDVRYVLKASGMPYNQISRTRRPASEMTWESADDVLHVSLPPTMHDVQLMLPGPEIEPIISTPYGILLARVKSDLNATPIWVLSDPDLIATHGLHRGTNTPIAVAMVRAAMKHNTRGDVVFDEVIHGHEKIPSFEERLLQFPLLPATIQVALLLVFLLWTFALRFGPPLRPQEARAPGKAFVVNNTAELLTHGNHSAHTTERYIWMVLQDTARALHAPPRQSQAELITWLQTRAASQSVEVDLRALTHRAHTYADGIERARAVHLLELALHVDRFRREMTS